MITNYINRIIYINIYTSAYTYVSICILHCTLKRVFTLIQIENKAKLWEVKVILRASTVRSHLF